MAGGRKQYTEARDWILKQFESTDGKPVELTRADLIQRYRRSDLNCVADTIDSHLRQLAAFPGHEPKDGVKRLYVARIHHQNGHERGRASPVYALGSGPDHPDYRKPSQTYTALWHRRNRENEKMLRQAEAERRETERRRALKRRPAWDQLTVALFGPQEKRK